jgi:hypothetical protein
VVVEVLVDVVDVLVVDVEVVVVEEEVVEVLVEVGGRVVVVDDEVVLEDVVDVLVVVAGAPSSFEARRAKMIRMAATATMRIATPHRSGLPAALFSPFVGGVAAGGSPSG